LLIVIAFPYWISYAIAKGEVNSKEFHMKYSPLIEGLKGDKKALFYMNYYFMIRRLLLAIVVVAIDDYPSLQCIFMALVSALNTYILARIRPYESLWDHFIELFNEQCVLICSLCYFAMTDAQPSYTLKLQAGWVLVGVTLFSFGLNAIFSVFAVIYQVYRYIKRYFYRRKALKMIKLKAL
jgi:hypothetical protein